MTRQTARPRGYVALMFNGGFGLLFWGKLFSITGVYIHGLVAAIVVFDATHSALAVALVSAVQFGPQLLLAPLTGKLVDHGHARIQILTGRVLCVLGSGSLGLWFWTIGADKSGTILAGTVLAASLITGIGFVLGGPALNSIIPNMIRPGELPRAMNLNTVPMTIGRIAGPAIGAFLAAYLGPVQAFTASAVGHMVFLVLLIFMVIPETEPPSKDQDMSVVSALRHVYRDRPLLLLLLAVALTGVGTEPSISMTPLIARNLGGGEELVGLLSGSFGVGAVAGFVVVGVGLRKTGVPVMNALGLTMMVCGLLLPMVPLTVAVVAGFAAIGVGFTVAFTCATTLIQERSPGHIRGRIMAFWMMGFVGARPIAGLIQGGIADLTSVSVALLISACVLGGMTYLCRPSKVVESRPADS